MFIGDSETANDAQSESRWHQSVRVHATALRHWTRRILGGDEGLDDVMQEVALATVTSSNLPNDQDKVLPWLKAVARHKVQDHWRKVERQQRLRDKVVSETQEVVQPTADWVLEVDQLQDVREALASLPEDARRLLVRKYSEGHSYEEIAEAEGITTKAVEYRLGKARDQLRERLKKHPRDE